MRDSNRPLKVAVVGGSLGGLCAGVALRGIGCEVEVYERAPGTMTSRGAGIVVQDTLLSLLRRHGAPELPATSCLQRRYLVPDGGDDGVVTALPQRFTSWSAIYRTLRSIFPDDRYHLGSTLTDFVQADGGVVAHIAKRGEVQADLLVCADGSYSETRRRLLPEVEPRYSGYVAWRGTLDEDRAPPALARFFDRSFTCCEARSGGHILCYFIPGDGATTRPGQRQLNWVWYVPVPPGPELNRLLTDRTGKMHGASVPAGMVPSALTIELHESPHASCTRASSRWFRRAPNRSSRLFSMSRCRTWCSGAFACSAMRLSRYDRTQRWGRPRRRRTPRPWQQSSQPIRPIQTAS